MMQDAIFGTINGISRWQWRLIQLKRAIFINIFERIWQLAAPHLDVAVAIDDALVRRLGRAVGSSQPVDMCRHAVPAVAH